MNPLQKTTTNGTVTRIYFWFSKKVAFTRRQVNLLSEFKAHGNRGVMAAT